jgi:hypothetical protein
MPKRELLIKHMEKEMAAITDGQNVFYLPRHLLPSGAGEGDIIKLAVALDSGAMARRRREKKLKRLAPAPGQ